MNNKKGFFGRLWKRLTPLNLDEHQTDLVKELNRLEDAFLRQEKGVAARRASQWAGKVAAGATASSGMLGIASIFGTASTGTAIGTLSGAAFTNASLAWLGGSVAAGGAIVGGVGLAAGIFAFFGVKWAWLRFFIGKPRDESDLSLREQMVYTSITAIRAGVESLPNDQNRSFSYYVLWTRSLSPLLKEVRSLQNGYAAAWPMLARKRLRGSIRGLEKLRAKAQGRLAQKASIHVGVFATVVSMLQSGTYRFTEDQLLVLDAFRRSTSELAEATPDQIAEYLSNYEGDSRLRLLRNIKGIYHELAVVDAENNDGDAWFAEIAVNVQQEGFDLRYVNRDTGEVVEQQLKTNVSDVYTHRGRYDHPIAAPTDVAERFDDVADTGFTNEDLDSSVHSTVDKLDHGLDDSLENISDASLTAAFIAMAINIGAGIRAGDAKEDIARTSVQKAGNAFGVAGVLAIAAEAIL